ncbi:MAG: TraR/DksA family transcriptional regulator, partial [Methylococcales bacterium]|nr:TraR/DksA family transcriptional regulator [Methylococcales bacterium]
WEDHRIRHVGEYHDNTEHKVGRRLELESQIISSKRAQGRLIEVDRALKRLYDGSYGLCESCGELIPPARLEVLPCATLCINCKSKEEMSQVNCDRNRGIR